MSGLRNDLARRLRAGGAASERQQSDVARALDSDAEPTLMARADSRHAARKNLATLLNELREDVRTLVVHEVHLLDAELADLLLAEILAFAARAPAGTARTTARAAFTAGTTVSAAGSAMAATFTPRRSTMRLSLLLFLSHTILPFSLETGNTKFEKRNWKH